MTNNLSPKLRAVLTAIAPKPAETLNDETRWSRGAGLTLIIALLWLTLTPGLYFLGYAYPTDGWTTTAPVTFILAANLSDTPSLLRAGDEVVAINGQPLTHDSSPPLPLERQAGQVLRYTLVRAGQTLEVEVTLTRRSLSAYLRNLATDQEGWVGWASALFSLLVAAFVFLRRPGNTAARYLLLIFSSALAVSNFNSGNTLYAFAYPFWLSFWYNVVSVAPFWFFFPSWILLLLIFPVRKWPMRRFPRALPCTLYGMPILILWPGTWLQTLGDSRWLDVLGVLPIAAMVGGVAVTLLSTFIHNWLTIRAPVQRAQLRWLTLGLGVGWGGGFALSIYGVLSNQLWLSLIGGPLRFLFPVTLAIAIFRYRLFDIDLLIRRTVQYTVISGLGFSAYLLAVGGTSLLFQARSDLAAGLITLVVLVSALIWLRPRLETWMNKYLPLPQLPPEVLAELERERVERENKKANKETGEEAVGGDTRLHGPWRIIMRVVWLVITLAGFGLFVAGLPQLIANSQQICTAQAMACLNLGSPTAEQAKQIAELGLSLQMYGFLNVAPFVLKMLVVSGLGVLLFLRKSDNWLICIFSLLQILFGTTLAPTSNALIAAYLDWPILWWLWMMLIVIRENCFVLFFALFPNGRPAPRWMIWFVIFHVVTSLTVFFPNTLIAQALGTIFAPMLVISLLAMLGAQIYRYRRVSTSIERQQTKWVVVGVALLIGLTLLSVFYTFVINPDLVITPVFLLNKLIAQLAIMALPVSLAIAILRYRLFDIDLLIRRTVQYTVISGLGFSTYLLAVSGMSLLFQARSDLAAGIITLVVLVSAFVWLRPRLETWMNKYLPLPQLPPEVVAEREPTKPEKEIKQAVKKVVPLMDTNPARLQGNWLAITRITWVMLALSAVIGFISSFPTHLDPQQSLCNPPTIPCMRTLLLPSEAALLPQLGLSLTSYHWISRVSELSFVVLWLALSALIFWRKSNDRMAVITALFMIGFPFSLASGSATQPVLKLLSGFVLFFNGILPILFFLFPTGEFVPRWTRWVVYLFLPVWSVRTVLQVGWTLIYGNEVQPTGIVFTLLLRVAPVIYFVVFGLSLLSQIYRYWRISNPIERQQTNWIFISVLTLPVFDLVLRGVIIPPLFPALIQPGLTHIVYNLLSNPVYVIGFFLVPVAFAISIFRYRLYTVDLIIRRTVIYGGLVGGLALLYFGGVTLLQFLSQTITGPQSNLVIVLITLGIVALFNPVRTRAQNWVDRAFYREKVDFREAFTAFAREVRAIIDLPELLRTLVNRTTDLLHITHGAVYLRGLETERIGELRVAEGKNLPDGLEMLTLSDEMLERLQAGHPVSRTDHKAFPLLIPLIAPTTQFSNAPMRNTPSLIGLLALGPRLSDQHYSSEDQTLLIGLADQAGTALYVAQLIQDKQAEAQRREASERRLQTHRDSPAGRAEALALMLQTQPAAAEEIYRLTAQAGNDRDAAALLEALPPALLDGGLPQLAALADGFRYLLASATAPEVLPVGLRLLIENLAGDAQALYRLGQCATEAASITAITEWQLEPALAADSYLQNLQRALRELQPVSEALRAYERVETAQDKLAYLASAIDHLSRVDRFARTELNAADRPIVQRIADNWLAVATGAMSELQTRARLVAQLLTRHTRTGESVPLALIIRNEGRGSALNLKVSLAASADYTLVDETYQIDRLSPGEETQIELRIRPHLAPNLAQFRARFILLYDDSRGRDQVENFADVVYLMAEEGEFQFIPNPYVVGTPLQTGSALFFGRADIFNFIQENLAAAHQNNLVLIGQRRTGKTSLLKQLSAQLGETYIAVYLDGQSLALDPGLPNFFYSLATEIAFALEDHGLALASPELETFTHSPALTFEHKFLTEVRAALGSKRLLLLLDEFEEIEGAVRRGNLDASVFSFLRHLIQHTTHLSVIFCGTHRMEELAADYWSVLFNISLYKHVAFLAQPEAITLIQAPVAPFGMKYDDLALDKMWRVTAGHPYFLQLLCHSLVNRHNKDRRNYLTIADVNTALEEILATGEAHFVYLWTESTRTERLVLTALSRLMPLTGHATPILVTDYLKERGLVLERRVVADAMHHLALRDILRAQNKEAAGEILLADVYAWQLGLLGLWVEKYKSLSRVADEGQD